MSFDDHGEDDIFRQLLELQGEVDRLETFDTEAAWQKVEKYIEKHERVVRMRSFVLRFAAVLCIPLLFAAILLALSNFSLRKEQTYSLVTAVSPPGFTSQIILPDSSVVWLNGESKLRYPVQFKKGGKRMVELDGEGQFEVKSDSIHPFIVKLSDGFEVIAHGTLFNISAYHSDPELMVTLEHGAVNVRLNDRLTIGMHPNEQMKYHHADKTYSLMTIDPREFSSWRSGCLVFKDQPLDEVLRQLSHRYNVDFEVVNPNHRLLSFRASYKNQTLEQILDNLKMVAPISWSYIRSLESRTDSVIPQKIKIKIK